MTKRVFNFSAGPCILPVSVLEEAQRDLVSLPGFGMSVIEMSHRSALIIDIMENAEANIRQLYGLPDNYRVLFLQGGATLQFSMVAMNFLRGQDKPADYIVTGAWGDKAIKEAKREGTVNVVWNGKSDNFIQVPTDDQLALSDAPAYVHYTSNETIQGVQFPTEPTSNGAPLVCDMSSDFLSRPIDVERYSLIYAGAQKNAGPAGVTMVIARDDFLETAPDGLHTMLDYRTHAKKQSAHNTPPVFAIYIVNLVTGWLLNEMGGLSGIEQVNREKAMMLYDTIDQSNGFYIGHAQTASRSMMNVTFRTATPELDKKFLTEAKAYDLQTLAGHRSVQGMRASIYNAMPIAGTEALRDFMVKFQQENQ